MMSQDIDGIISGVADVAEQIGAVAFAITDVDALAVTTPDGGRVGCLTEAIIYLAKNAGAIADAINEVSEAIRGA